jgi:hypothetical protein
LRDKQLEDYEKSLKKNKSIKEKTLNEEIDLVRQKLLKHKIKPNYQNDLDLSLNLKNLNKQLELIKIQKISENLK